MLAPLEDQQVAGIVMLLPGGLVYLGAGLALLAAWLDAAGRRRAAWP
jgi:cytochrome c oxidase assembly factor CtaG